MKATPLAVIVSQVVKAQEKLLKEINCATSMNT
jgi:hypothetical protein